MKIVANFRPSSPKNFPSDIIYDLQEAIAYCNYHLMNKHKMMYEKITPYYRYDSCDIIEFSINIIPLSDWDGHLLTTANISQIAKYLLSHYPDKYRPFVGKGNGNRLFNVNVEEVK